MTAGSGPSARPPPPPPPGAPPPPPVPPRPPPPPTRRYVCASGPGFGGCGRMATVAEPLESFVAQAVLYRLDTPELAAALRDARPAHQEPDQLTSQVAAHERMLDG